MPHILVAATQESRDRVRLTLDGHFSYLFTTSAAEAHKALESEIEAVLCALTFDESGMFDLLRYVRDNKRTQAIPFFCVRTSDDVLSPVLLQSVKISTDALGANGLIDLYSWRQELGDENALHRLRLLLKSVAPGARHASAPDLTDLKQPSSLLT